MITTYVWTCNNTIFTDFSEWELITLRPLCLECHRSEGLSSSLDNDNSSCSIIDEEQSTFPIQCLQASSFEPDAATEIQNFYYEKYNDLKQKKKFHYRDVRFPISKCKKKKTFSQCIIKTFWKYFWIKLFITLQLEDEIRLLPVGELNPGLPRDRRGYLPLY